MHDPEAIAAIVSKSLDDIGEIKKIYVAFSGGLDSTVLLHATRQCFQGDLIALHVNHGIEKFADEWEEHCSNLAKDWGIDFQASRVSLPAVGNFEALARNARYDFFRRQVKSSGLLLLGHHADDQLETIWMRIISGRGTYGMPQTRRLGGMDGAGRIFRPLLGLRRSQLAKYARFFGLPWVEDPSNQMLERDRNYVRHKVLPVLRLNCPDLDKSVLRLSAASKKLDQAVVSLLGGSNRKLPLADIPQDTEIASGIIRAWLTMFEKPLPTAASLREFAVQLESGTDRQPILTLGNESLRRYKGYLYYVDNEPLDYSKIGPIQPGIIQFPLGRIVLKIADEAAFSTDQDIFLDRLGNLSGAKILYNGYHRRVSVLLQQASVPPWNRPNYPVLIDSDGTVLSVPGIANRDRKPVNFGENGYSINIDLIKDLH